MSQGFKQHGIEHLSASSLNLWAAEPAVWLMERLLGHRSPPSALMARGKAVEDGVHAGLIDPSVQVEACVARALATYDREMTLNPDERRDSERAQIQGYVEHGIAEPFAFVVGEEADAVKFQGVHTVFEFLQTAIHVRHGECREYAKSLGIVGANFCREIIDFTGKRISRSHRQALEYLAVLSRYARLSPRRGRERQETGQKGQQAEHTSGK